MPDATRRVTLQDDRRIIALISDFGFRISDFIMDLTTFLTQRRPVWRKLEEMLEQVEGSGLGSLDEDQSVEFGRLYRRTASDLNQAQTFVSGDATVRYLNDLVARAYGAIYGKTRTDWWGFFVFLVWGYPTVFRRHWPHLALATSLFAAGCLLGVLAATYDPAVARAYLLPADMPTIQPPKEGEGQEAAMPPGMVAAFSGMLFTHNLTVTLVAFALGVTLGVGSAWMMFYNGVTTGALAAVFIEAGQFKAFETGILPHGVVEIPAMLIGGAAGFVLAEAIFRARPWPRSEEFIRKGREALYLLFGAVPLLMCAAVIEAGVARAPEQLLSSDFKLGLAGVVGLLFLAYVLLFGWGWRPKAGSETP
jgi:uncharacterized membrane protein SpoIIM required for sporulation